MKCPRCGDILNGVVFRSGSRTGRAGHCFTCGYTSGIPGVQELSGKIENVRFLLNGDAARAIAAQEAVEMARAMPGGLFAASPVLTLVQWVRAVIGLAWTCREPQIAVTIQPRTGELETVAAELVMSPRALRVPRWRLLFPRVVFL
ncbi:MAG: hypothetical protein IT405_03550 [Candidatus Yanofskybacteria bacterium]|nr:hypothetical protein [Candidatus Yanofskybacteria bacterium]